jgi:CheY-like chemotaxis protein
MGDDCITTLIVDDEADIRLLMRLVLEAAGTDCIVIGEAASGQEAIDLFEVMRPDCVVLDVMMPGMDGIETADRIRALAPDQKVILCSAHVDPGLASQLDCDGYLPKSEVDRLPALVRQVVN